MPGGRPPKYEEVMCQQVLDLGAQGCGRAEIAAELDISRQTLYRWEHEYPEFCDALSRAHDLSLAWWEKQGRKNLSAKDFNAGLYKQCMSGRFPAEPYRERVEHTGRDGGAIETKTEATVTTILDTSRLTDEQLAAIASIRIDPHAG
jgi:hypothetical protein